VAISVSDLFVALFSAPTGHITALGWPFYIFFSSLFIGGIIAASFDNERLQGAFSILYCCELLIFILITQSSIPA